MRGYLTVLYGGAPIADSEFAMAPFPPAGIEIDVKPVLAGVSASSSYELLSVHSPMIAQENMRIKMPSMPCVA